MGRTGSCWDNAATESFFGLLNAETGTTIREWACLRPYSSNTERAAVLAAAA